MNKPILKIEIRENGLVGKLLTPEVVKKLPGIVLLGGSDGGIPPEFFAEKLASQGYAVFALGYFAEEGLPQYMENIPLEYFQKAILWFKSQSNVQENNIGLIGYSRGGELALLLGSTFPKLINAIITYVPCSAVCGGFPHPNKPAWIFNNKPITPFLSALMSNEEIFTEANDLFLACKEKKIPFHANTSEDPYAIADLFLARNLHDDALKSAAIPVEKIQCPLLILTGEEDQIWPSATYGKLIMERLEQNNSSIQRKHLCYPNAGHGLAAPYNDAIYHPVGEFWCKLGGTPEGNEYATQASWKEVLNFLEKTLGKSYDDNK